MYDADDISQVRRSRWAGVRVDGGSVWQGRWRHGRQLRMDKHPCCRSDFCRLRHCMRTSSYEIVRSRRREPIREYSLCEYLLKAADSFLTLLHAVRCGLGGRAQLYVDRSRCAATPHPSAAMRAFSRDQTPLRICGCTFLAAGHQLVAEKTSSCVPVKVNGSFISRPLTHPPLDRSSRATDKIVVNHDEMLRWYVAEVMMPYVAAQLFPPLQEFLPGLAVAIGRMSHKRVLVRPPSFACVRDWLAAPGAFEALSRRKGTAAGAAKGASPWCVRD